MRRPGVFKLLYLELAYEKAKTEGRLRSLADLQESSAMERSSASTEIHDRGHHVPRAPPIMWSMGAGSDVMKRIAAPMIRCVFTSFILNCWSICGLSGLEVEISG